MKIKIKINNIINLSRLNFMNKLKLDLSMFKKKDLILEN